MNIFPGRQQSADPRIAVTLEQLLALPAALRKQPGVASLQRRPGEQPSRRRGPGLSFDQLREYLPGDDVRTIDWRVTRRTGRVHTRIFHQESEQPLLLLVEQSESLYFGSVDKLKSVIAAEYAAQQLFAALAARQPVAMTLLGDIEPVRFAPVRFRAGALPMLSALADSNAALCEPALSAALPAGSVVAELEQLAARQLRGKELLVVADWSLLRELPVALLGYLAQRNQLLLAVVVDPLEWQPPAGLYGELLDVAGRVQSVALSRAAAANQHAANSALWQSWQQRCAVVGAGLVAIGEQLPAILRSDVAQ